MRDPLPMVHGVEAELIGGPKDGQQMLLDEPYNEFDVLMPHQPHPMRARTGIYRRAIMRGDGSPIEYWWQGER